MDLRTRYLGLVLRTPLVISASPLSATVAGVRRLEDAGGAAVVLPSLFEENIGDVRPTRDTRRAYLPDHPELTVGPDWYLDHVAACAAAVGIPIIASLNGRTPGGWTEYARSMEAAGAAALELNLYSIPVDPTLSGAQVEEAHLEVVEAVRRQVALPLAVKLSPYFTNLVHFGCRLAEAGADGLVLFNRFADLDVDLDQGSLELRVALSTSEALAPVLRGVRLLSGQVGADLAATGGLHTSDDVLKALFVGADVTMVCSVLLKHGPEYLRQLESGLRTWLERHGCNALAEVKGRLSHRRHPGLPGFERLEYVHALSTYAQTRPEVTGTKGDDE